MSTFIYIQIYIFLLEQFTHIHMCMYTHTYIHTYIDIDLYISLRTSILEQTDKALKLAKTDASSFITQANALVSTIQEKTSKSLFFLFSVSSVVLVLFHLSVSFLVRLVLLSMSCPFCVVSTIQENISKSLIFPFSPLFPLLDALFPRLSLVPSCMSHRVHQSMCIMQEASFNVHQSMCINQCASFNVHHSRE